MPARVPVEAHITLGPGAAAKAAPPPAAAPPATAAPATASTSAPAGAHRASAAAKQQPGSPAAASGQAPAASVHGAAPGAAAQGAAELPRPTTDMLPRLTKDLSEGGSPGGGARQLAKAATRKAIQLAATASDNRKVKAEVVATLVGQLGARGEDVQQAAVWSLRALAGNDHNRRAMAAAGVVPALIKMLERSDDDDVRVDIAAILAALAAPDAEDSAKARHSVAEAVPALVAMLKGDDMDCHRAGAGTLCSIVDADPALIPVAAKAGAVGALLGVLVGGDEGAKESAALALGHLAAARPQRAEILAAGGLSSLTLVLLEAPGSPGSEAAAWVLHQLAHGDHETVRAVARAGAVPPLVEMLKMAHEGGATRCATVLALLSEIASEPPCRKDIVNADAVPALVRLLRAADVGTARAAAQIVRYIAEEDEPHRHDLRTAGAAEALAGLVGAANRELALVAMSALGYVAQAGPKLKKLHVPDAVFPHVVALLTSKDLAARRTAAGLLAVATGTPANNSALCGARGVLPLLELFLWDDSSCKEAAGKALANLSLSELPALDLSRSAEAGASWGPLAAALCGLLGTPGHRAAQEAAVGAAYALSAGGREEGDEARAALLGAGAVRVLVPLLHIENGSVRCQEGALKTLRALAAASDEAAVAIAEAGALPTLTGFLLEGRAGRCGPAAGTLLCTLGGVAAPQTTAAFRACTAATRQVHALQAAEDKAQRRAAEHASAVLSRDRTLRREMARLKQRQSGSTCSCFFW